MRRLWPELMLLGVAAAFTLSFAGGSIWLDEAFSVQVAESGWARSWELLRHDNGPPLYYLVLRGWIRAFGDGERVLRALSALLAVAAVAPAIALGRELSGGSRAGGMAAGLLLACSAQLALHGRAARMYALVMLLAALSTWLWARWLRGVERGGAGLRHRDEAAPAAPAEQASVAAAPAEQVSVAAAPAEQVSVAAAPAEQASAAAAPTPHLAGAPDRATLPDATRTLAAFALVTTLGAYAHYWFAFLTLAQLAGAAVVLRRRCVPLLAAAAAGWAPFAAWTPVFLAQLRNGSRAWIPSPGPWAPLEAFAGVLGRPATIALVALIAMLAWRRRPRRGDRDSGAGWDGAGADHGSAAPMTARSPLFAPALKAALALLAVALLVPFAISLWRPLFWPVRHAAVIVPAAAALLSASLARLLQARALAAVLSGVLALRAATHAAEAQLASLREPDSDRAAAAYLMASAAPGDAVIFVGLSGPAITYYLRGEPLDLHAYPAEMAQHPAWIDPSRLAPADLEAEAAALDRALRLRPVWLVWTQGDPVATGLRARLGARPLDRSATLRGLFHDRLERFLPHRIAAP